MSVEVKQGCRYLVRFPSGSIEDVRVREVAGSGRFVRVSSAQRLEEPPFWIDLEDRSVAETFIEELPQDRGRP